MRVGLLALLLACSAIIPGSRAHTRRPALSLRLRGGQGDTSRNNPSNDADDNLPPLSGQELSDHEDNKPPVRRRRRRRRKTTVAAAETRAVAIPDLKESSFLVLKALLNALQKFWVAWEDLLNVRAKRMILAVICLLLALRWSRHRYSSESPIAPMLTAVGVQQLYSALLGDSMHDVEGDKIARSCAVVTARGQLR